jgi:hypothetical protein
LLAAKARWQEAAEAHKREVGTLRTQVVKLEAEKLNSDRLYHNTVSEVERLSSKLKEATGKQTTALAAMVAASQAKTQLTGRIIAHSPFLCCTAGFIVSMFVAVQSPMG